MIEILTGPHAGKMAVVEVQAARRYNARKFFVVRDRPTPGADGTPDDAPGGPGAEVVCPLPDALRGLELVEETVQPAVWWRYVVAVLSLGFLAFVARGTRRRRYAIRFTQEHAFEIATDDRDEQKTLAALDAPMPDTVPRHEEGDADEGSLPGAAREGSPAP